MSSQAFAQLVRRYPHPHTSRHLWLIPKYLEWNQWYYIYYPFATFTSLTIPVSKVISYYAREFFSFLGSTGGLNFCSSESV